MTVSATFSVGVEFAWLRGPFRALVNLDDDFIELVPTGLLKRAGVKPVRAERSDVLAIERDRWRRRGLRDAVHGPSQDPLAAQTVGTCPAMVQARREREPT